MGRREFVKGAALAAAGSVRDAMAVSGQSANTSAEPTSPARHGSGSEKKVRRDGLQISAPGLAAFISGTAKDERTASRNSGRAMDAGVNFFDNAWEYHDGESETRVGNALKGQA